MSSIERGAVCVFAKPPRPGEVKTRLATAVGQEHAARLAAAFFADTWATVSELAWAEPVLATTDPGAEAWRHLGDADIWSQGDGDLGMRLAVVLTRALVLYPWAIAVGTDSPGLPAARLLEARTALDTHDAVIGPAEDGGFYLIGLRTCPSGLFSELPWSVDDTCVRTESRLRALGLRTQVLEPWFDVDRPEDLERLRDELATGRLEAPATVKALAAPATRW